MLHQLILDKLAIKQSNIMAPNNIFEMGVDELIRLGYSKVEKCDIRNGDMMAATKNNDLWIILNDIQHFSKYLNDKTVIYRKL